VIEATNIIVAAYSARLVAMIPSHTDLARCLGATALIALCVTLHAEEPKRVPKIEQTNSIGMKLRRIPTGKINIRITDDDILTRPASDTVEIEIKKPIYMGMYEVTQEEYVRVMGSNPSSFHLAGENRHRVRDLNTKRMPVENITWAMAQEFCEKLSALPEEKKAGRLYRLPTSDEWEYAARAGSSKQVLYAFGSTLDPEQANFDGSALVSEKGKGAFLRRPALVGSYKPNAWGLFDMHGNVWEWTADEFVAQDKEGKPAGVRRILRGGSWLNRARDCAASTRLIIAPDVQFNNIGFRIVCETTD
jgi:formylglycine-generating enzyme required for sulfatase activity